MPSLNTGNAILSNAIAVDSSYNVGIGGAASGSYKLQVTGTSNLTGALTGTSATFSGLTLNSGNAVLNTNFQTGTSAGWDVNTFFTGGNSGAEVSLNLGYAGATTDTFIKRGSNGRLDLGTAATARLSIASTGAATFSSTLTTSGKITANGGGLLLDLVGGSDTFSRVTGNRGNGDNLHIANIEFYNSFSSRLVGEMRGITGAGGTQSNSGQLAFYTNDNGTYAERMRITSGGNVGIGTSSPSYPLSFADNFTNAGTISSGGNLNGSAYFGQGGLVVGTQSTTGHTALMTNSSGRDILFGGWNGSTNQERMRITSGGNVLIGTTTDASFNFVATPTGHSYLGNTMQISAGDYGGTERQGAFGVAEWANVSSATINLATIFPRINFTSRTLSVLVQIGNASTTTTMCSCLVLFGRTVNSTWSSTIIANININGLALSSVSGSGTTITLNFGTATFGSAMITILNRA
jgi:hypothetical protein